VVEKIRLRTRLLTNTTQATAAGLKTA